MSLLRANKPNRQTASALKDSDMGGTILNRRITPIESRLSAFPETLSNPSTFPPPPRVLLSNNVEARFKFTTIADPKVMAYNVYRFRNEAGAHVAERVAIFPQSPDPGIASIEYTDPSSTGVNYYWATTVNAAGVESPRVLLGFGAAPDGLIEKTGLTDAAVNDVMNIVLNSGSRAAGIIDWHLFASDGTDHQSLCGIVEFAAVNKAGVYTTDIRAVPNVVPANEARAVSAGTFTAVWAIVTGTNLITIRVTPTSSLVPTTLTLTYKLINLGRSQIVPL